MEDQDELFASIFSSSSSSAKPLASSNKPSPFSLAASNNNASKIKKYFFQSAGRPKWIRQREQARQLESSSIESISPSELTRKRNKASVPFSLLNKHV